MIGTIRDLRAVAISHFRFKRDKVKPYLPGDHLLAQLAPREAFLVYLVQAAERELPAFMKQTRFIMTDECCLLRFEEMAAGRLGTRARTGLNAIERGLAADFEAALAGALGQPTATFSGKISEAQDYVWPEVDQIYDTIGYLEANREAGYP